MLSTHIDGENENLQSDHDSDKSLKELSCHDDDNDEIFIKASDDTLA